MVRPGRATLYSIWLAFGEVFLFALSAWNSILARLSFRTFVHRLPITVCPARILATIKSGTRWNARHHPAVRAECTADYF